LLEKRIESSRDALDPLDDLLNAAPEVVLEWMRRKAALADGTTVDLPVCDEDDVDDVLVQAMLVEGEWSVSHLRKSTNAWPQVRLALLRDLSGASLASAGHRSGMSINGASVTYSRHRHCMLECPEYAGRVAKLAERALAACHRVD
jgi:hypothetical protein